MPQIAQAAAQTLPFYATFAFIILDCNLESHMNNAGTEKRFVIAVVCPDATFSHLLQEAQRHNLTILEMVPFRKDATDLSAQIQAGRPVLFVYSDGKSMLAQSEAEIQQGLSLC